MEEPAIDPENESETEYNTEPEDQGTEVPVVPVPVEEESDLDTDVESTAESDIEYASDPEIEDTEIQGTEDPVNMPIQEADIDEDMEEEDTISENYDEFLQKLDKQFTDHIVDEYHNEEYHINPDEMTKLCQLKKNNKGFIEDPLHKTSPIMSKYEYTNIIGLRTKQLGDGAPPMIDVPEEMIDNYTIAEIELKQKVLPFVVKRPLGHGGCEYWRINDLEILL